MIIQDLSGFENLTGLSINSKFSFTIMSDYLKTLSAEQLEYLIKKEVDEYLGKEFTYTVTNLNTPNVNTKGDKITFKMEIRENEAY